MSETRTIAARTLSGVLWGYGSYLGVRALALVSTAVLARILEPDAFGVVALALVLVALLEAISDAGLGQALIVAGDEAHDRAETVFVMGIATGAALAGACLLAAPAVAGFFSEP